MNRAPWFSKTAPSVPAQAGAGAQEQDPVAAAPGGVFARDLSELSSLTTPFARDPFYRLRPSFSAEAAELSLELANMAYTLELEPWKEAGWNDFSIQIDDTLQSGVTYGNSADGERMQGLVSAWKLHRAKAALKELNPVAQVMSALRQRERSDTIKAVCMGHQLPGGQYLIAIGFMGTGRRFYDWISNLRLTTEEGFHKGFYQLCTYFEQSAESIVFPKIAAELELEGLTLGQILLDLRSARSRFRLWMAGHSQGGAVMQVFAHRLLTDWGVLPQNMVGYGFASPTVATGRLVYDPAAYPLYHIINSDDMVPRIGALLHLGLCLSYQASGEMRAQTYELSALPADAAAYEALRPYQLQMTDTASVLLYSTAFMQCVAEEKGEETLNGLMNRWWSVAVVDRALHFAGDKAMGMVERVTENAQAAYTALTGAPMPESELLILRDSLRPIVRAFPLRRLMGAIVSYCRPPHRIMRNQQREPGAYAYIVQKGLASLRPFVWLNPKTGIPKKRFADGFGLRMAAAADARAPRRRPLPAARKPHALARGKRRTGHTMARARR